MKDEKICLVAEIVQDTPHEVDYFLTNLSQMDEDFNGNNGEEYLWEKAKKAGFKSNSEYALFEAGKQPDLAKRIEEFVKIWMESDGFYEEYHLKIQRKGKKLFISLAFFVGESN